MKKTEKDLMEKFVINCDGRYMNTIFKFYRDAVEAVDYYEATDPYSIYTIVKILAPTDND